VLFKGKRVQPLGLSALMEERGPQDGNEEEENNISGGSSADSNGVGGSLVRKRNHDDGGSSTDNGEDGNPDAVEYADTEGENVADREDEVERSCRSCGYCTGDPIATGAAQGSSKGKKRAKGAQPGRKIKDPNKSPWSWQLSMAFFLDHVYIPPDVSHQDKVKHGPIEPGDGICGR
jgi:hypothetical protein